MTGLSALLSIQGRMQGGETHESTLIAVFLAQSSVRGRAVMGMLVSMLMVCLSPGSIQPNTEHGFARMKLGAPEKFASLLTDMKNYDLSMLLRVQACHHPSLFQLVPRTGQ